MSSTLEGVTRATILAVDDHPPNLAALEASLEPLGQGVLRAYSGEEALKVLLSRDVAVILMDVRMPGMDGIETARQIKQRERSREVPIIFVTASDADAASIFAGYSSGAVDYIQKPYDPQILRSKVSVFVDLFHRAEALKRAHARAREPLGKLREAVAALGPKHRASLSTLVDELERSLQP